MNDLDKNGQLLVLLAATVSTSSSSSEFATSPESKALLFVAAGIAADLGVLVNIELNADYFLVGLDAAFRDLALERRVRVRVPAPERCVGDGLWMTTGTSGLDSSADSPASLLISMGAGAGAATCGKEGVLDNV